MKYRILLIIAAFFLLTGCNVVKEDELPPAQRLSQTELTNSPNSGAIKIINPPADIKPGETVTMTIQGRSGIVYNIAATYKYDGRYVSSSQTRKSDKDGIITWTWKVGDKTNPGIYPIAVTGGGQTLLTTYRVK